MTSFEIIRSILQHLIAQYYQNRNGPVGIILFRAEGKDVLTLQ